METLTWAQTTRLLLFWSGTSQPPSLGLAHAEEGGFEWTVARSRSSPASFPEASTCDTTLKLPEYGSKAELETKLLLAIELGYTGFAFV